MKKRNGVYWCDRGWQPVHFGYCPSKKDWHKLCKFLGITHPYPTADGSVTTFDRTNGQTLCVMTLRNTKRATKAGLVGLVVHEATHIWQIIQGHIGETAPGDEMEAYAVQAITQELITAVWEDRK